MAREAVKVRQSWIRERGWDDRSYCLVTNQGRRCRFKNLIVFWEPKSLEPTSQARQPSKHNQVLESDLKVVRKAKEVGQPWTRESGRDVIRPWRRAWSCRPARRRSESSVNRDGSGEGGRDAS